MKKIVKAMILTVSISLGTVFYGQHVNADLANDYYHNEDSFLNTINKSNNPDYFDPASQDQFYTKIPKGKHYISIKKIIGASSSLNTLPIYALTPGDVHYVSSIKEVGGKYRLYMPSYKKYVSANKENIKFITTGQVANISWAANPKNHGDVVYNEIQIPRIISQAVDSKADVKGPYSEAKQNKYARQIQKNSIILANYFKNKTVYDRQYYVKRYKYYDKIFGLHGNYSLRNWKAYVPESLRHAGKNL